MFQLTSKDRTVFPFELSRSITASMPEIDAVQLKRVLEQVVHTLKYANMGLSKSGSIRMSNVVCLPNVQMLLEEWLESEGKIEGYIGILDSLLGQKSQRKIDGTETPVPSPRMQSPRLQSPRPLYGIGSVDSVASPRSSKYPTPVCSPRPLNSTTSASASIALNTSQRLNKSGNNVPVLEEIIVRAGTELRLPAFTNYRNAITPRAVPAQYFNEGKELCLNAMLHLDDLIKKTHRILDRFRCLHIRDIAKEANKVFQLLNEMAKFNTIFQEIYASKGMDSPEREANAMKIIVEWWDTLTEWIKLYNEVQQAPDCRIPFETEDFKKIKVELALIRAAEIQKTQFIRRINRFFSTKHKEESTLVPRGFLKHFLDALSQFSIGDKSAHSIKVQEILKAMISSGLLYALFDSLEALDIFTRVNPQAKTFIGNLEQYIMASSAGADVSGTLPDEELPPTFEDVAGLICVPGFKAVYEFIQDINEKSLEVYFLRFVHHTKTELEQKLISLRGMSTASFLILSIMQNNGEDFSLLHRTIEQFFAEKSMMSKIFLGFHEALDRLVEAEVKVQVDKAHKQESMEPQPNPERDEFLNLKVGLEFSPHNNFFVRNMEWILNQKYEIAFRQIAEKLNIKAEHLFFPNGRFNVGGWSVFHFTAALEPRFVTPYQLYCLAERLKSSLELKSDVALLKESCYGNDVHSQRKNGISEEDKKDAAGFVEQIISIKVFEEMCRFFELIFTYETAYKQRCQEKGELASFVAFILSGHINKTSTSLKGIELSSKLQFLGEEYNASIEALYVQIIAPNAIGMVFKNLLLDVYGKLNYTRMTINRICELAKDTVGRVLENKEDVEGMVETYRCGLGVLGESIQTAVKYCLENQLQKTSEYLFLQLESLGKMVALELLVLKEPAIPPANSEGNREPSLHASPVRQRSFSLKSVAS